MSTLSSLMELWVAKTIPCQQWTEKVAELQQAGIVMSDKLKTITTRKYVEIKMAQGQFGAVLPLLVSEPIQSGVNTGQTLVLADSDSAAARGKFVAVELVTMLTDVPITDVGATWVFVGLGPSGPQPLNSIFSGCPSLTAYLSPPAPRLQMPPPRPPRTLSPQSSPQEPLFHLSP